MKPSTLDYLRATLLMLGILALVVVLGLALAGCGLTPNDGKVHTSSTSVTRSGVHVMVCPPYCGGHR